MGKGAENVVLRRTWRGVGLAAGAAAALIAGFLTVPAQATSESSGYTVAVAAKPCPPGRPGLAARVGWRKQDVNWLVMTTHVQVANCKGRIKYVRILVESFNNGFLTQRKTDAFGTYPSKYRNKNMMVHWPNYLPTIYEAGQSGRYVGIGFADVFPDSAPRKAAINQRPWELSTCTRRVDGLEVDTSGVTFKVSVWPLDGKRRVIRDIGAAMLGPFTCLQPGISTAE